MNDGFELRNVSFVYEDGTSVFRGMDLDIPRGEFLGLLAPNGGGKSTLLMLLAGLIEPTKGEIRLDGRALDEIPEDERFQQVGFLFQNPDDQLFASTLGEDVAFGPRNLGLDEEEVQERVRSALNDVELNEPLEKPVHRLSFGQRKRASLAGILAMGAEILLLDEPTAELDPVSQHRTFQLLKRLNQEQNKTIVVASHHIDLFGGPGERMGIIASEDRLVTGSPLEIFRDRELLRSASLRPPIIIQLVERLQRQGLLTLPDGDSAGELLQSFLREEWEGISPPVSDPSD